MCCCSLFVVVVAATFDNHHLATIQKIRAHTQSRVENISYCVDSMTTAAMKNDNNNNNIGGIHTHRKHIMCRHNYTLICRCFFHSILHRSSVCTIQGSVSLRVCLTPQLLCAHVYVVTSQGNWEISRESEKNTLNVFTTMTHWHRSTNTRACQTTIRHSQTLPHTYTFTKRSSISKRHTHAHHAKDCDKNTPPFERARKQISWTVESLHTPKPFT